MVKLLTEQGKSKETKTYRGEGNQEIVLSTFCSRYLLTCKRCYQIDLISKSLELRRKVCGINWEITGIESKVMDLDIV